MPPVPLWRDCGHVISDKVRSGSNPASWYLRSLADRTPTAVSYSWTARCRPCAGRRSSHERCSCWVVWLCLAGQRTQTRSVPSVTVNRPGQKRDGGERRVMLQLSVQLAAGGLGHPGRPGRNIRPDRGGLRTGPPGGPLSASPATRRPVQSELALVQMRRRDGLIQRLRPSSLDHRNGPARTVQPIRSRPYRGFGTTLGPRLSGAARGSSPRVRSWSCALPASDGDIELAPHVTG